MLLSQLDLLILQEGVLYWKFHYPHCSTNFLQFVLPARLHRLYIERRHANLEHFGQTKTCCVVSVYLPVWCSMTSVLAFNCAMCNLHQWSHQTPQQVALKPVWEFSPMAVLHANLIKPLPEGWNSQNERSYQYILSLVDLATCYL